MSLINKKVVFKVDVKNPVAARGSKEFPGLVVDRFYKGLKGRDGLEIGVQYMVSSDAGNVHLVGPENITKILL